MAERRGVVPEDFFHYRLVSDARIAPDGARVAYVRQRIDRAKNRYYTAIHLIGADGSGDRAFTGGDHADHSPRWSPDGSRIAFLSDRSDSAQIWLISVSGGEATQLTRLAEGSIGAFAWSPDGTRIAFNYRPKPEWMRKSAAEAREKEHRSTPPLVVKRLAYREEGAGYFGDERWHLFVIDVATGEQVQLTSGATDQGEPVWSPDGKRIAFITNRSADPDVTAYLKEIRTVPAVGGEESLIEAPAGAKGHLSWSPDGRWFAYFGNDDLTDVWSCRDPHLWIVPAAGGAGRDLTAALDRPAGDWVLGDLQSFGGGDSGPVWLPDSASVLMLVSDCGASHVYRARITGELENLTPGLPAEIGSLSLAADGTRIASILGDATMPSEVHIAQLEVGACDWRRITASNDAALAQFALEAPEEFRCPGEAGEVHGWLLRPPAGAPENGGKAPLILYVHGGPHTQYGWSVLHEIQCLAAMGYAVLFTNPRGSRGYGQDHTSAIRGDWGGADYRDVMAAVDHAVTLPGIDPERVGVTGGSYGGFMTNWVIGHTHRFRCAVTQRSVVNLHSMSGTCDFNFSETSYFGGNAWSEPQGLLAQSPLSHLGEARTPTLIIHSEGDLRCPMEQAEQLFAVLKRRGCEVEFVRYPREANHGLSRNGPPDLRLDRIQRIAAWFQRHL